MTRLFNDPARFRDDMVDGFVAAYDRYVRRVPGASGVLRAQGPVPGRSEPLFTVDPAKMELGLGIHGEPGVATTERLSATELADLLVERLLAERPADADGRAGVILNGLGATKYEELFVVWKAVAAQLAATGVEVISPEVGELVTSLDMAGCSLTLHWLDDELAELWNAPADTPAFRRGDVSGMTPLRTASPDAQPQVTAATESQTAPSATAASRRLARTVHGCLAAMRDTVAEHEEYLGDIDAVAGDGDHGRGMLRAIGDTVGDVDVPAPPVVVAALRTGARTIGELGGAQVGDKTLLDALVPFVDALEQQVSTGADLVTAWQQAATQATKAAEATCARRPKVGRARPLADKSIGTPDPGAVSLALCVTAVGTVLAAECGGER